MAKDVYNGLDPMEARNYEQVVEDTSKGIALYPEFLGAYMRRSIAYQELGEKQKAELDLQRVTELQPKDAREYQIRGEFLPGENKLTKLWLISTRP